MFLIEANISLKLQLAKHLIFEDLVAIISG
jgi:hypothetical protein